MAKGSVNRVILLGNLGKDPEVRYTPNGVAITNISIATTEIWKDKQTGQNQEQTEWHRIVLFARLGEIAAEYLRKGSKVYIEGRIRTNKWQDKTTGQDRYMTEIIADNIQLLSSKGSTGGSTPEMGSGFEKANTEASTSGASSSSAAPADSFDDDIPF